MADRRRISTSSCSHSGSPTRLRDYRRRRSGESSYDSSRVRREGRDFSNKKKTLEQLIRLNKASRMALKRMRSSIPLLLLLLRSLLPKMTVTSRNASIQTTAEPPLLLAFSLLRRKLQEVRIELLDRKRRRALQPLDCFKTRKLLLLLLPLPLLLPPLVLRNPPLLQKSPALPSAMLARRMSSAECRP